MKNYQVTKVVSLVLLILILAVIFWCSRNWLLQDRESFAVAIKAYGYWAPVIMTLVIIVEVIIAPFPGGWVPLVSGYIFGSFWGGLYAWIGNVIGATISFFLAYYLGKPFVEKIINPEKMNHYRQWLGRKWILVFLVYLIPIFPIDLITFSLGLSGIKLKRFFPIIAIALIPHMFFLSFFGHRVNESSWNHLQPMLSPILIFLFFLLIYWQIKRRNNIKNQIHAQ